MESYTHTRTYSQVNRTEKKSHKYFSTKMNRIKSYFKKVYCRKHALNSYVLFINAGKKLTNEEENPKYPLF